MRWRPCWVTLLIAAALAAQAACAEPAPAPATAREPHVHEDPPMTAPPAPEAPPVLTAEAELAAHVGKVVTLRGEVSRTRIATLLGVDIEEGGQGGLMAEATGRLERSDVTQDEIDDRVATLGQYAHRGPGTFYRLVATDGRGLSVARPIAP